MSNKAVCSHIIWLCRLKMQSSSCIVNSWDIKRHISSQSCGSNTTAPPRSKKSSSPTNLPLKRPFTRQINVHPEQSPRSPGSGSKSHVFLWFLPHIWFLMHLYDYAPPPHISWTIKNKCVHFSIILNSPLCPIKYSSVSLSNSVWMDWETSGSLKAQQMKKSEESEDT